MDHHHLSWVHTWPDSERQDFSARDPNVPGAECRLFLARGGPMDGKWYWVANSPTATLGGGYAENQSEAASAAEAAYFAGMRTD